MSAHCGSAACYQRGCRRQECLAAVRAAAAARSRAIAYGTWQPFTDAEPVRSHLLALRDAGIGWRRAAGLAGVPVQTVIALLYRDPPVRRVRPGTAAALLAVRADADTLAPGARTDATGSRRRLQALVAIGHTQASLAARLGLSPPNLRRGPLGSGLITARTARAVAGLYDELWDKPAPDSPGAQRARRHAQARGWPPPLAWDDETIGDPDAGPAEGWQRRKRLSRQDIADEAAELFRQGYDRPLAAERLGMKRSSLDTVLSRVCARRDDDEERADDVA